MNDYFDWIDWINRARPHYRRVVFGDEKGKKLIFSTAFSLMDSPSTISEQRDKKRREKMLTTVKWYYPTKLSLQPIQSSMNEKDFVSPGSESKEKKTQKERESSELEEFSIGSENLKEPKSLPSHNASLLETNKSTTIPVIPLESEVLYISYIYNLFLSCMCLISAS